MEGATNSGSRGRAAFKQEHIQGRHLSHRRSLSGCHEKPMASNFCRLGSGSTPARCSERWTYTQCCRAPILLSLTRSSFSFLPGLCTITSGASA